MQRFLVGSQDTSHVISQFGYNHASCMSVDPRLDVLPTFQITAITPGADPACRAACARASAWTR